MTLEFFLERAHAQSDGLGGIPQGARECRGQRLQFGIRGVAGAQLLQALNALCAFALGAAPAGGARRHTRHAARRGAPRARPARGRRGAARSPTPRGAAARAARAWSRSASRTVPSICSRAPSAARAASRASSARERAALLGGRGRLGLRDQLLALVAPSEHPLGPALGDLADLRGGREPHAPLGRHRHAAEVRGQALEILDHPGVRQQARREREDRRGPLHQLE